MKYLIHEILPLIRNYLQILIGAMENFDDRWVFK